ncbi:MAG: prephenate dehydrogenase/arogenate dehydrogenase family protein [Candidatus Omnitrophota bacterium]
MKKPQCITIIGVGLIGGAMGMILKKKKLAREIIGVTRHKHSLNNAKRLKAIDRGTLNVELAVKDADIVVLAMPVGKMFAMVKDIKAFLKPGCILTDVGSTKTEVVRDIEKILPKGVYFVGAHPLAGSEKSGVLSAHADLFKHNVCIITPTKQTNYRALTTIKQLWRNLGADVVSMNCQRHDKIVAEISHLPHILSVSLVNTVSQKFLRYAAGGFKDVSRLAGAEAVIWQDIFTTNRENVCIAINKYIKILTKINTLLKQENSLCNLRLLKILQHAKKIKDETVLQKNNCN